jgi:hypothetical protein
VCWEQGEWSMNQTNTRDCCWSLQGFNQDAFFQGSGPRIIVWQLHPVLSNLITTMFHGTTDRTTIFKATMLVHKKLVHDTFSKVNPYKLVETSTLQSWTCES